MAEQISPVVRLEVAKAIAPYYPQGQFPQMAWVDDGGWHLEYWSNKVRVTSCAWYAAPAHIPVLNWLEQEKGYVYQRVLRQDGKPIWVCSLMLADRFDDPDSLILAICEHMEAANVRH